jgi:hypothetical protein
LGLDLAFLGMGCSQYSCHFPCKIPQYKAEDFQHDEREILLIQKFGDLPGVFVKGYKKSDNLRFFSLASSCEHVAFQLTHLSQI